jgi:glycosyltransferase involved in cell wall biosynthesis
LRILIAIGVPRQKEAGAALVVLNNASELTKRGHTVDCWFSDDVLARPAKPKRFEALIFAITVAKRILRAPEKYNVVNLHAPWGCAYGLYCKLFRPAGAPPYVMTMQGSEERYAQVMAREHRKGRAWQFAWKNRAWHRIYHQTMYSLSIRSADYGAVANRESVVIAEILHGRDPGRVSFVPNGAEERFFMTREYLDRLPLRVLYVGTWLDRKGIYYLVAAFDSLARKLPALELTIAGCLSPEQVVKEFFASGVRDQVRVIPFNVRDEMPALYAAHDIFVFPSLIEGMPLSLLEAMAAGMPVVTTNTSGMADLVENGLNGLLVPSADAEALANATERLCRSAELREQLGKNAQQSMQRFTWERAAEKLERVLSLAAMHAEAEQSSLPHTGKVSGDQS